MMGNAFFRKDGASRVRINIMSRKPVVTIVTSPPLITVSVDVATAEAKSISISLTVPTIPTETVETA